MRSKSIYVITTLLVLLIAVLIYWNKDISISKQDSNSNTASTTRNSLRMSNPASEFCISSNGKLVIETREDGSQYGLCYFDDNRACEEWTMYRGECAVGGVKTTGYDTVDRKFCAWSGGRTYAVENSICTFLNGSTCSTRDFYDGSCTHVK